MISDGLLTVGIYARQRLLADPEVRSLVGDRIYPSVAPEGTEGAFIVYERDSYNELHSKMGVYMEEAQLGYEIVSADYDTGLQLMLALHRVLKGKHENYTFQTILSREFYEEKKHRQILVFKIKDYGI